MAKPSVLIVEDEREIADLIRFHVEREGFETAVVGSGRTALTSIERDPPDLVLLDLMLPDIQGLDVCRRLRREPATQNLPIIIVSARGEEADIVAGIELGADDYVTKPFSPRVLIARIKNVLRRVAEPAASARQEILGGIVVIDTERHTVTVDGAAVDLTLTEFGILHFLAQRPGFVRTRDQIIAAVHGSTTVLSRRTVDVHVTALRRKLGERSQLIETVRGVGYRLREHALEGTA